MQDTQQLNLILEEYLQQFRTYASSQSFDDEPETLYGPIQYALTNSGKGLRPVLVLMGCEMFSENLEAALPAALAIEWFHNFTLIHDDIMDNAPLRRGKPSVFSKYGANSAILSGDALLIKAYQQLNFSPTDILPDLISMFNFTALGVCEGQQYDVDFETKENVTEADYLHMIGLKTAVLLAASVYLGARIGGGNKEIAKELYQGTYDIGVAFQIQDDILDSFGNKETFGKRIGGDILNNKKTILLIHALEHAKPKELKKLEYYLDIDYSGDEEEKIEAVKAIYRSTGAKAYAEQVRDALFKEGNALIEKKCQKPEVFNRFYAFTHWLMHRDV